VARNPTAVISPRPRTRDGPSISAPLVALAKQRGNKILGSEVKLISLISAMSPFNSAKSRDLAVTKPELQLDQIWDTRDVLLVGNETRLQRERLPLENVTRSSRSAISVLPRPSAAMRTNNVQTGTPIRTRVAYRTIAKPIAYR
jgi:hypothetical protein